MTDITKKVIEISNTLALLSIEEQLLVLQKVQHEVIERSKGTVSSAKVNSGAKAELFVCMAMKDITWNGDENNGADAVDTEGRGVELKTFMYRQTTHCNAHLTFPSRVLKSSDAEYMAMVVRHFQTSPKYVGGLRMVAMTKSKSETHHWYILPRDMLPAIVENHLKKNPNAKEYNPGGKPCSKCKLIHRMIQLQLAAGRGEVMKGSPDNVCRALPASQVADGVTLPEIH